MKKKGAKAPAAGKRNRATAPRASQTRQPQQAAVNINLGGAPLAPVVEADPVPGDELELTPAEQARANEDRMFWSALAGEGGCRVYKVDRRTREAQYIDNFPKQDIREDLSFIGRTYGAGLYHFEPCNEKGQFVKRVKFSYAVGPYPDMDLIRETPVQDVAPFDPDRVSAKDLMLMMVEMMKAKPADDGFTKRDILELATQRGGGVGQEIMTTVVTKAIERAFERPETAIDAAPNMSFGERLISSLIPHLGPQLAAGLANFAAPAAAPPAAPPPAPMASPVAALPVPAASAVPINPLPIVVTAGSPGDPPPVQADSAPAPVAGPDSLIPAPGGNGHVNSADPVAIELRPFLPYLIEPAAANKPVAEVSGAIISALESAKKDWALDLLLGMDDPVGYVVKIEPGLEPYRVWVGQLLETFRPAAAEPVPA